MDVFNLRVSAALPSLIPREPSVSGLSSLCTRPEGRPWDHDPTLGCGQRFLASRPSLLFSPCPEAGEVRLAWRAVDEGLRPTGAGLALPGGASELCCSGKAACSRSPHPHSQGLPPSTRIRLLSTPDGGEAFRAAEPGVTGRRLQVHPQTCLPESAAYPPLEGLPNLMLFPQERGAAKGKAWCLTNPWKWSSPRRLPGAPGVSLGTKAILSTHLPDVSQLQGHWQDRSGSRGSHTPPGCDGHTSSKASFFRAACRGPERVAGRLPTTCRSRARPTYQHLVGRRCRRGELCNEQAVSPLRGPGKHRAAPSPTPDRCT